MWVRGEGGNGDVRKYQYSETIGMESRSLHHADTIAAKIERQPAAERPNRGEPRHRTRPTASPMSGGVRPRPRGVPRDTFAGKTFRFCATDRIEIFENNSILINFALKINRISYTKAKYRQTTESGAPVAKIDRKSVV